MHQKTHQDLLETQLRVQDVDFKVRDHREAAVGLLVGQHRMMDSALELYKEVAPGREEGH